MPFTNPQGICRGHKGVSQQTDWLPYAAAAVPGDNSIDMLTNDLGLVVITNDKGELEGFDVYVGGGMGR